MNFIEARDKLRVVHRISLTKRDGEYRVNFIGGTEASAYYSDDLSDAFATGVAMRHGETTATAAKVAPT